MSTLLRVLRHWAPARTCSAPVHAMSSCTATRWAHQGTCAHLSTHTSSIIQSVAPTNICLVGAPGVGKGTYATYLRDLLAVPHVSSGDLLRERVRRNPTSEESQRIREALSSGSLMDDTYIGGIVHEHMKSADCSRGVLLDGFPRRTSQIDVLASFLDVNSVLHFTLREDLLIRKLTSRRVCEGCGANYNLAHIMEGPTRMPALLPKVENQCDHCSGALVQRDDDKEDVVRARLQLYNDLTFPVVAAYHQRGVRVINFPLISGKDDTIPLLHELAIKEGWLSQGD